MLRKLTIVVLSLALVALFGMQVHSTAAEGTSAAQQGNGSCGCPTHSTCCYDCNGNRLCVHNILECPVCPWS